jgi:hypothetical protein
MSNEAPTDTVHSVHEMKQELLSALRKELKDAIEPLIREVQSLGIDVARLRDRDAPPAVTGRRPETETQGSGHSSYPWERKRATPRIG